LNIKNKSGITAKLLGTLILFFVVVLSLVWISEVFLFSKAYESYQVNMMNKVAKEIKESKDDSKLEELAYENQVCMVKTNSFVIESEYNTMMNGCALRKNNKSVLSIINDFISNGDEIKSYRFKNSDNNVSGYLYGLKQNDDSYIFIYSNLEDTSSVTKILTTQMIYITVIAMAFAVAMAYIVSKKITKPIVDITDKARLLGAKKDIHFEHEGIKEMDDLADALNLAQSEIGKTEELGRDLMANVSHDLKTPLTMIKAYAEMIKDITYKDKAKMNENLGVIIDETDRLTLLVNDILNLSKLQSNADNLNLEKYDLVSEIKSIIKRYDIIKETENYTFKLDMPDKLIVKADRNKINQVIYNLVNNAINYTGDDKTVTIKVSKDKLVQIIDTGKGINKDEINNIWNRYYKSDKKHQRNVVSTGLGLSIVKEILIKHNFEYGVTSSNQGTTFYFKMK
jgi:signal transduction histidine kinase